MSRKPAPNLQYAALPYRRRADGVFEVMLITSRETRRWIIPKGWPVQRLAPHESAAREALEEGGLIGRTGEHSIGIFHYEKEFADGSAVPCTVKVFALEVEQQLTTWPEQDRRSTHWFTLAGGRRCSARDGATRDNPESGRTSCLGYVVVCLHLAGVPGRQR